MAQETKELEVKCVLSEEELIDDLKYRTDYGSFEDFDKVSKLIDLYNKEKEKNEALNVKLTDKICNGVEEQVLEEYRQKLKNSISKDKIREKIKECKKAKRKYPMSAIIPAQIEILKELLGDDTNE